MKLQVCFKKFIEKIKITTWPVMLNIGMEKLLKDNYIRAATAYLEGYQNYPKSNKAPDNLLKLGITMVQLGRKIKDVK